MKVIVMPEAERNVDIIYDWLAERSMAGASRWFRAYLEALRKLEESVFAAAWPERAVDLEKTCDKHSFEQPRVIGIDWSSESRVTKCTFCTCAAMGKMTSGNLQVV